MYDVPMVYCVVPTHNRLNVTKRFLEYIVEQDYPAIHVVIDDSNSTDGTLGYLSQVARPKLTVLKGHKSLWWGGAMRLGMRYVVDAAAPKDYLLMINDDVRIEREYISTLVRESVANRGAIVGSTQRDESSGERLTSGYRVDYWCMRFIAVDHWDQQASVDALPGRGVLFPVIAIRRAGAVRARLFPHYLGDIEYTARVSEMGWRLLISNSASVFTDSKPSDMHVRATGLASRYLSFKSRTNLLQRLLFFSVRGPLFLRITAIPRYPLSRLLPRSRRSSG